MITIADHFVVRIGGVPPRRLQALRSPATFRACTRTFRLERSLDAQCDTLVDLLFAEIRRAFDSGRPDVARALLRLKRAVYNRRHALDQLVDVDAIAWLEPETARRVTRWLRTGRLLALRRGLARVMFDGALLDQRTYLRTTVRETPAFRNGLLLASRSLFDDLPRHLEAPVMCATNHVRRVEQSVLAYLYRMATRTTPFGSFVSVGAGRWTDDGALATIQLEHLEQRSVVRPPLQTLSRIMDALARHPEVRPSAMVCLNRTLRASTERVRFLRRGITSAADRLSIAESLVSMKRTPTLDAVLSLTRDAGRALSYGELLAALAGPEADALVRDRARAFLDRLVDEQLLEMMFGVPDQAVDPLASVRATLARLDAPVVRDVRRMLDAIAADLDRYPSMPTTDRADAGDRIDRAFGEILAWFGLSPEPTFRHRLYEDSHAGDAMALSRHLLSPLGDGFRVLSSVAPAFDARLIDQERLSALFRERYGEGGECGDLFEFWTLYREREKEQPPSPVAAMQRRINRQFAESYSAAAAQGAEEWEIDIAGVGPDLQELWTRYLPHARSQDCLVQFCRTNGTRRVVLNHAIPGWGKYFSRFCAFLGGDGPASLVASLRAFTADHLGRTAIPCDIVGSFSHNANLRPILTDHEIDYPATLSDRPPSARIALDDLVLRHDAARQAVRLYSKRLGREVVPLHLGFLNEISVPPFCQFLLQFGPGQGGLTFEGGAFDTACKAHAARFDRHGVAYYPRIVAGDLIVRRAYWLVTREDMPSLEDKTEFDLYLDLCRWWTAKGLPCVCRVEPDFLRKSIASPATGPDLGSARREWKPLEQGQFFDCASAVSMSLLARLLRSTDSALCVEEMLPELDDPTVRVGPDNECHAAEFIVEVSYPPGLA